MNRVKTIGLMAAAEAVGLLACMKVLSLSWTQYSSGEVLWGSAVFFVWVLGFLMLGYLAKDRRKFLMGSGVYLLIALGDMMLKTMTITGDDLYWHVQGMSWSGSIDAFLGLFMAWPVMVFPCDALGMPWMAPYILFFGAGMIGLALGAQRKETSLS